MAKSRALTRFQPRPIVISMPRRRGRVRRAARAVGHVARRGYHRGKAHLPALGLGIAAAGVGYADAQGWFDVIPKIGGKKALGVGIVGYAATRFFSNRWLRLGGYAMLMAGAYDFGRVQGGGASGYGDEAEGDGGGGRGSGL